jgi:signal transduction histidine kinase
LRPSLRPTAPALLITAAVSGLLCFWAVSAAPASVRTPLAWCSVAAALALSAAVTVATHALWTGKQLRQRNSVLLARADRLSADALRATEDVRRAVMDAQRAKDAFTRSETGRAAALSAGANAAGRMQALATGMLADLREMEDRHTDEDVLGDLLHLDHRTAQAGRLADSIAVLTGARSGRRWAKPIVMESILRGAMGRISDYQRVRLHSASEVAVAGHAAEGVMHALAELLDNAANFSPPTAEVHVYVEEVPAGIVITVEDSGLVMSDVQLRRAERAVAGAPEQSGLNGLTGTRLGLAVVGRLARKHGLTVSFRPSARGGTGVLMMLPQDVLGPVRPAASAPGQATPPATAGTQLPAEAGTAETPTAAAEPAGGPTAPSAGSWDSPGAPGPGGGRSESPAAAAASTELGESGLPQRRRGRTLAAAQSRTARSGHQPAAGTAPAADSPTQALRFSSFRQAVRTNSPHPAPSTHPEGDAP